MQKIRHRLKIAQGHLRKTIDMEEKGAYCIDVVHQLQAVQKALREVENLVLDNHLRTCVAKAIRQGKDKEVIDEVMKVMNKRGE